MQWHPRLGIHAANVAPEFGVAETRALINILEKNNPFEGVDILDGGTGGFHLLEYFEKYEHVILVDATLDGNTPGTIRLIKPRFAKDFPPAMSTHDIGLKDMICAMQILGNIPEIDLFVVSIESIQQQGIELTPEIEAVVPAVMERINELLQKNIETVRLSLSETAELLAV